MRVDPAAQAELPFMILEIVTSQEERFVKFFNEAQAITTRFHMLELIPGLERRLCGRSLKNGRRGPYEL